MYTSTPTLYIGDDDKGYHAIMSRAVEREFIRNPQTAATAYGYLGAITTNVYPDWYTNMIFQIAEPYPITAHDAYWFGQIHAAICNGDVLLATVEVGAEPSSDKEVQENNRRLSTIHNMCYLDDAEEEVSVSFDARFTPSMELGDGRLSWNAPIYAGRVDGDSRIEMQIGPRSVPLEVGFTRPDTTVWHLATDSGLARWPYGSREIHILIKVNPSLWAATITAWKDRKLK